MAEYELHGLTHEQKVQRLEYDSMAITTTAANIFTSDVGAGQRRYICGILLANSSTGTNEVTINRVDAANNSDEFIDSIPVPPEGIQQFPVGGKCPDVDQPVLILDGSQNLEFDLDTAIVGSGAMDVTVWFYDDPLEGS
jgi:hypothetical protein